MEVSSLPIAVGVKGEMERILGSVRLIEPSVSRTPPIIVMLVHTGCV